VFSLRGGGAKSSLRVRGAAGGGPPLDRDAIPAIWDVWDAKTPQQQAADCLAADDTHIKRFEGLTDAELAGLSYDFMGLKLDGAGLVRLRLSEHAVHTWDVAVVVDPEAVVAPSAVAPLVPQLAFLAERTALRCGGPLRVGLGATPPEGDALLDVSDKVPLVPGPGGGTEVDGEIAPPTEGLLRLSYGRHDPGHPPPVRISGAADLLDRTRAVFPGI